MRPGPNCERCGDVETVKHRLYEVMHYSQLLLDPPWWNNHAWLDLQFPGSHTEAGGQSAQYHLQCLSPVATSAHPRYTHQKYLPDPNTRKKRWHHLLMDESTSFCKIGDGLTKDYHQFGLYFVPNLLLFLIHRTWKIFQSDLSSSKVARHQSSSSLTLNRSAS